jgi:hypothetical protein
MRKETMVSVRSKGEINFILKALLDSSTGSMCVQQKIL